MNLSATAARLDFAPTRENFALVLEHFLVSNEILAVTEDECEKSIHEAWDHICGVYDVAKKLNLWPPKHTWIGLKCRGYDYSIYLSETDQDWHLGSWMIKDGDSQSPGSFVLLSIIMRFGSNQISSLLYELKDVGLQPAHVTLDQLTWMFAML